jgi:chromosome partitioning protein
MKMIVTVGGIKGGSGKTTVATNLAVIRASEGRDVILIDSDDQETASDFTILRNERQVGAPSYTSIKLTGAAVRTETLRLREKYQDIIIDTGGRDTTSQRAALTVADMLLVPFVPRSFDVWTLEKVGALVTEMRAANPSLRAHAFLNRTDPRGQDNDEAAEVLRDTEALSFLDAPLGTRKAFGNAAAQGLAVTELKPQDPKATGEIMILRRYVFDLSEISQMSGVGA